MSDSTGLSALHLALLKRGEIHIEGMIDDMLSDYVHECMIHLKINESPNIDVYIRSEGGEIAAGLDIYDEIRLYRGETRGIVMGFAQSMGAIILQACTHRVAARHAEVLIHNNTMIRQLTDRDVRRRGDPLADVRRDLLLLRHSTDDIFVRSTGRTKKEIRAQCKLGRPMTAEEALKFGLLDELI